MSQVIEDALRACSLEYQVELAQQQPFIEKRIRQLEAELHEQRSALLAVRSSKAQLKAYSPCINGTYKCPYCWVGQSMISILQQEECFGDEDDYLQCPVCEREISVPTISFAPPAALRIVG